MVKCGTEEEQQGAKAGNRGKRDSQVSIALRKPPPKADQDESS